jgi:hypothetical protein
MGAEGCSAELTGADGCSTEAEPVAEADGPAAGGLGFSGELAGAEGCSEEPGLEVCSELMGE